MSKGAHIPETDWSAPATRGDLMSFKHDLEKRFDQLREDLERKIDGVRGDLERKIDGVRGESQLGLKDVQVNVARTVWTAVATLGAVGILLRLF